MTNEAHSGEATRGLSGRSADELTLAAVRRGELGLSDLRIHPSTLEHQAEVAEGHDNPQLAENLRRAAELTQLGDAEVLGIYEALRPRRSSHEPSSRSSQTRFPSGACRARLLSSGKRPRSTDGAG